MNQNSKRFFERLAHEPAVLVHVAATEGSVPRETGTWMAVFAQALVGTIGGGHLEYEAVANARERLRGVAGPEFQRVVLGPSLGQCCGGVVQLRFEPVQAAQAAELAKRLASQLQPVALFGGGHVGHALVQALAPLPFALTWIDSRDGIFADSPHGFSAGPPQGKMRPPGGQGATQSEGPWGLDVICEQSDPVQAAVPHLAPGSHVLIMSFSHAEDLDVVLACLQRQRERADLGFIGLIGSKTKWASFRQRLLARGFSDAEQAHVTCPIGLPGLRGKEPEVIAVAVAAQLLLLQS